jgi:hypothetical protein
MLNAHLSQGEIIFSLTFTAHEEKFRLCYDVWPKMRTAEH